MRSIGLAALLCGCVTTSHPYVAATINGTVAAFGGSLVVWGGSTSETSFERPAGGVIILLAALAETISLTLDRDPVPPSRDHDANVAGIRPRRVLPGLDTIVNAPSHLPRTPLVDR